MSKEQTYKTHRRYVPIYHFFVEPVLALNIGAQWLSFSRYRTPFRAWMIVVAIALMAMAWMARSMALKAQDRVIRLEERLRLGSILPPDARGRVDQLTPAQLVALRFASDDDAVSLVPRCLSGELTKGEDIKKEIKTWRADNFRV